MSNNYLNTNWGDVELNESGEVDSNAVIAFTRGHCHSFALAMHQETGWPIFGIGTAFFNDDEPGHCVVYCPQLDDYIDIEGPGVEGRWPHLFEHVQLVTAEQAANFRTYRKAQVEIAKPFVKTVLQNLPLCGGTMNLHELIAEFKRNNTYYEDQTAAWGACDRVSDRFIEFARKHGYEFKRYTFVTTGDPGTSDRPNPEPEFFPRIIPQQKAMAAHAQPHKKVHLLPKIS